MFFTTETLANVIEASKLRWMLSNHDIYTSSDCQVIIDVLFLTSQNLVSSKTYLSTRVSWTFNRLKGLRFMMPSNGNNFLIQTLKIEYFTIEVGKLFYSLF